MHRTIPALIAVVVFWGLLLGVSAVLSDSVVDPFAAFAASAFVGIVVFRALRRGRT